MSSIQNDTTPPDGKFAVSDPLSSGDVDTAPKPKASAEVLPDCQLQPTAGLEDSSRELQDGADQLRTAVSDFAQGSVDGLEAAAEYVRTTDGRQMLATLERFIRDNPGVSVAVAAAFGFVVGRSIRRE